MRGDGAVEPSTTTDALRILRRAPPGRVALLALLLLATSVTDGIGMLLIVPLLSVLVEAGGTAAPGIAGEIARGLGALRIPLTLPALLAVFVAVIALRGAVQLGAERVGLSLQLRVVDDLRALCIDRLLRADWRWIARQTRTDHAALVISEVGRIGAAIQAMTALAVGAAAIAALWVAALILSPAAALLVAGAMAVVFAAMARIRRSAARLGERQVRANRALMADVQHGLAGLKLAKTLGAEGRHAAAIGRTTEDLRRSRERFGHETSLARAAQQTIAAALLGAFVLIGHARLGLALPELLTLALLFGRLLPLSIAAQQHLSRLINAAPAHRAVDDFLAASARHAEPARPARPRPLSVLREVTLRDATLRHEGRAAPALDDVTLVLPARTTTAVLGPSGSGKSTLADLLTGLVAPDAGTLAVDGEVIEGPRRHDWRASVAYVPQEVFLHHDTIRANLLMARPDADDAALHRALDAASAGFVRDLPDGLDAVAGDDGLRLSGGERQRIALARALLRDPALLILDEATSALDAGNELRIRDTLRALHGRLTILLIGHRPATLEHADRVVVMEAGRIVRTGPPGAARAAR